MLTSPKYWTKTECTQRQHTELLFRWIWWTKLSSKNQVLPVFRFIVETPYHHLHSSPLKRSCPNQPIYPAGKKVFYKNMWLTLKKKKNLTVELTVLHKIFTNHSRLKGGFMHFHILLGLKQQFSARTTEKKNMLYIAYINYTFSLPVMFSAGLCIITAKCKEIEKGEKNGLLGNFPILEMRC